MTRPVRVYQEDWWPFRNLPNALERFERETGIKTELVWDKAGVGLIETMFDKMIRSFTDDDPPFDLVCCDEVMLRRFASRGRVLGLNQLMGRDGITLADATAETRRVVSFEGEVSACPASTSPTFCSTVGTCSTATPSRFRKAGTRSNRSEPSSRRRFAATARPSSTLSQAAEQEAAGMRSGRWGPCWVPMGASGRPETSRWSRWASRSARPLPRTLTC